MNKKIKQVAEKAGLKIEVMLDDSNREVECYLDQNGSVPSVEHMGRFAEMIIQECLDQCYNSGMNDSLYEGQLKAAAYIEEHFGIEDEEGNLDSSCPLCGEDGGTTCGMPDCKY